MSSFAASDGKGATRIRVAVLGGSGFVGQHLASTWRRLAAPSTSMRLLVHRSRPTWINFADDVRDVDLHDAASLAAALEDCNVLVTLLRPKGDGWLVDTMTRLLPTIGSKVGALIHASSIDVYGSVPGAILSEATVPQPMTDYAKEHLAIETLIGSGPVGSTILRLGAVFGPGGRNLVSMARHMGTERAWKLALRRAVNGKRRMHLVSVETVAEALHLVVGRPADVLLVTEDADDSNNFAFVQQRFAAAFHRYIPWIGRLPPFALRSMLRQRGGDYTDPFRRFSNKKLQGLGFRPSQPFNISIDRYAASLAEQYHRRTP